MKNPRLFIGIALLLPAIGGALAWWLVWRGPDTIRLPVVEGCTLHEQACAGELPGGGKMIFEISPKHPTSTDALQLNARFREAEPDYVGARFKGINMNMGQLEYLTYELSPSDTAGDSINFSGRGGVFACSAGVMEWLVLVKVRVDDAVHEIPFRFRTGAEPTERIEPEPKTDVY